MNKQPTRERIVEAADQLFYQQGFEHTSFAQIAVTVGISRGNFYYHFKTKDEILTAVIELRISKTQSMLIRWETEGKSPAERIRNFINIMLMNQSKIKRYGCPVGTLCSELAKLEHASQSDANRLFTLFRNWLCEQFLQLGHSKNADKLAMHVLARSQGIAVLSSAFEDEIFIQQEVEALNEWLAHLKT